MILSIIRVLNCFSIPHEEKNESTEIELTELSDTKSKVIQVDTTKLAEIPVQLSKPIPKIRTTFTPVPAPRTFKNFKPKTLPRSIPKPSIWKEISHKEI